MACRKEVVNSLLYEYCPDTLPPAADRVQSVMRGRLTDELTGLGLTRDVRVTTEIEHLTARTAANGVCGLAGNPAHLFPGLKSHAVALNMSVRTRRYLPQTFVANLGPFNTAAGSPADYPDFFAPVNLATIGMHRAATIIQGRCVRINGISREPLPNAVVELLGLWHRFPPANVDLDDVREEPNIISLLHGLYRQRTAGVDHVRQLDLTPRVGEKKLLLLPAEAGARQLRISNRVNLAAGHIVAVDLNNADLLEYIEVESVAGATTAGQSATVTLAYPLKKGHRQGIPVLRVNPESPPASSTNNFIRDAIPGDQTVFLNSLADIDNSTVEIFGTGSPEYHRVSLHRAVADAEGYFRLPPISRIALMKFRAHRDDLSDDIHIDYYSPDYDLFENSIDFVFG